MANEDIFAQPVPNLPLLRKVLDHIDAHPEEWDQWAWGLEVDANACGTAFCVAGHALVMSGYRTERCCSDPDCKELRFLDRDGDPIRPDDEGARILGLTEVETAIFDELNTRADLQRYAKEIAARAGEQL